MSPSPSTPPTSSAACRPFLIALGLTVAGFLVSVALREGGPFLVALLIGLGQAVPHLHAQATHSAPEAVQRPAPRVPLAGYRAPTRPIQLRQRCPYCHDHLLGAEERQECPACSAVYHEECLQEVSGTCLTLGCAKRRISA